MPRWSTRSCTRTTAEAVDIPDLQCSKVFCEQKAAISHACSKYATNTEEQFLMVVIADSAPDFHGPEDRVDHQSSGKVARQSRRLWAVRQLVGLAQFVHCDQVHRVAQKGWEFRQLPDITKLTQDILIREQLVGAICQQALCATKRECRYANRVTEAGSTVGVQIHRR